MLRITCVIVGMLCMLFFSACGGDAAEGGPEGATAYAPIPPGYDWPAHQKVLEAAITAGDQGAVRRHAWCLFAGINQPISDENPLPIWWTWETTKQLFETDLPGAKVLAKRRHGSKTSDVPPSGTDHGPAPCTPEICLSGPSYPVPEATWKKYGLPNDKPIQDGTHFESNGDIMVATESYSQAAAEAIRKYGYNKATTYYGLLANKVKIIAELPPKHVVTKHMFWPVKATGYSALPVFDGVPEAKWHVYNGYETWQRFVAADPSNGTPGKEVEVSFLYGVQAADAAGVKKDLPTRHVKAPTVPIDRFFHQKIDDGVWKQLSNNDRAMLDAACRWAHNKPFEVGDYVVAVAMHINTKEVPSWTMQSAWWTDTPDHGPYSKDRPDLPRAQGPWQHYLMTVAYGIPEKSGDLPMSYNPYIELAAGHPVPTNCRNCHTRAGWPQCNAYYLTTPGPGPLANLSLDDEIFKDLLLLDFQWVFTDRTR